MPQTVPALYEIEVNITRLLGASLSLLAHTALFLPQPVPEISLEELAEATQALEGHNRALILDATLDSEAMLAMQRNATRITHLAVLWRVAHHIERSGELLPEAEFKQILHILGPTADALFLLGTRIVALLLEAPYPERFPLEAFHWDLILVDGAFRAAHDALAQNRTLSRSGRRHARASLWALQVMRDALLIVASR